MLIVVCSLDIYIVNVARYFKYHKKPITLYFNNIISNKLFIIRKCEYIRTE